MDSKCSKIDLNAPQLAAEGTKRSKLHADRANAAQFIYARGIRHGMQRDINRLIEALIGLTCVNSLLDDDCITILIPARTVLTEETLRSIPITALVRIAVEPIHMLRIAKLAALVFRKRIGPKPKTQKQRLAMLERKRLRRLTENKA